MSKVTSKLQVTIPKVIAEQYAITPGDQIDFVPAGEALRVVLGAARNVPPTDGATARQRLFDEWLERARALVQGDPGDQSLPDTGRGWTRADLYEPPRGWPRDWPL